MKIADKRIEWEARFDAWKASGLTVAAWCREQGVNIHQMYYWVRNLKEDDTSVHEAGAQWLTVDLKDEPTTKTNQEPVFIHFGSLSVEVRPGADMTLLSNVVQVLQNP